MSQWTTRRRVHFCIAIALFTFVMWEEISDIAAMSMLPNHGHIMLVPFAMCYLLWIRRSRFQFVGYNPSLVGPLLILIAFFGIWIGRTWDVIAIGHLAVIICGVGVLASFIGRTFIILFLPVIMCSLFLIPIPGTVRTAVSIPLQELATSLVTPVIEIVNKEVTRVGGTLRVNGVLIAVGEACDGMRLIVPLAVVVYTFVYSLALNGWTRLFLVICSIPIAIACNVFRLVPTVFVYSEWPTWGQAIHDFAAWFMIPLAIFFLYLLVRILIWMEIPVSRWRLLNT